VYILVLERYEL